LTTTVAQPRASTAAAPVEPRGATNRSRYGWLLFLVVVLAFGVRLGLAFTDDAPSTDETAYLHSGLSLWSGDGFERDGRAEVHFPPGVPFVLGGVAQITGDAHDATVVVTLLAGTLLVLPLAAIGRRLAGDRGGLATALVVALCPGLTILMIDRGAGSEALYTLTLATGLWLALHLADLDGRRRSIGAGLLGALLGAAYLIRPEGVAYGALFVPLMVVPLVGGWRALRTRRLAAGWRRQVVPTFAAFGLALVVFIAPYVVYLHGETGRWQLTAKTQDASIEAWRAVAEGNRRARDAVLYELDDTGLGFAAGRSSLTALAADDPAGYLGIVGVNTEGILSDLFEPQFRPVVQVEGLELPVWLLLPAPLIFLGMWCAWRRRRDRNVIALVVAIALPVATALVFFSQPRYLIVAVAFVCVLVSVGLAQLPGRWRAVGALAAAALILASAAPQVPESHGWLHPREHTGPRVLGEWLAENTDPDARVMTRSMVVDFYADRPTVSMPYARLPEVLRFARHYGVEYLVADRWQMRRLRPQLIRLFRAIPVPGLRLVFEDRVEGELIRVFALEPPPEHIPRDAPGLGFTGDTAG